MVTCHGVGLRVSVLLHAYREKRRHSGRSSQHSKCCLEWRTLAQTLMTRRQHRQGFECKEKGGSEAKGKRTPCLQDGERVGAEEERIGVREGRNGKRGDHKEEEREKGVWTEDSAG